MYRWKLTQILAKSIQAYISFASYISETWLKRFNVLLPRLCIYWKVSPFLTRLPTWLRSVSGQISLWSCSCGPAWALCPIRARTTSWWYAAARRPSDSPPLAHSQRTEKWMRKQTDFNNLWFNVENSFFTYIFRVNLFLTNLQHM